MQTTGDRAPGGAGAQRTADGQVVEKKRVYEVAKDVGLDNKALVDKIRALGIEVKNHMSSLEPEDVARVKRALEKDRLENTVIERIQPTVIRRRNKNGPGVEAAPAPVAPRRPEPTLDRTNRIVGEPELPHRGPKRHVEVEPDDVEVEAHVAEPAKRPVHEEIPAAQVAKPEPRHEDPRAHTRRGAEVEVEAAAHTPEEVAEVEPTPRAHKPAHATHAASEKPVVHERPSAHAAPAATAAEPEAVAAAPRASTKRAEPERVERPQAPRASDHGTASSGTGPTERNPVARGSSRPERIVFPSRGARTERAPSAPPVNATAPPAAADAADGQSAQGRTPSKTQFEVELDRAREAAKAKEAALAAQRTTEPTSAPIAAGGRPAVGSIIELPLPRIQITERGPGGRPLAPGARTTAPQATIPGAGQVRGRFADSQRGGGRKPDMKGGQFARKTLLAPGKKARSTQITTPAEHKRVIKMEETIAVSEIAHQMGVKATEVLKKLWSMGMVGVNINQAIDLDTASLLANEFGFDVQNVAFQETAVFEDSTDSVEDLMPRAPVVTIMGHVDHGKTSLLDAIRHTDVAAGESGGITQHIGAYRVSAPGIGDVVFLDTPGHAAFTAMRARGAQATDVVVLVVAADDGAMPQTIEALNHAKDAKVPVVVAVNKSDKAAANPDRIRQQLSEQGLIPEEWGGDTQYRNVSAYTKTGIDELLEAIQLQAQILELRANPNKAAKGIVVEAKLDRNRGPMATILIQEGTLRVGDIVVTGEHLGKVRAMLNDKGQPVTEAGPSTPVEVLGIDGVPEAGDAVNNVENEKAAKTVIEHRRDIRRKKELAVTGKVSLENVLEKIQEGQVKELKIVLKTDVQGSAEAIREALNKLSTDAVRVNVIQAGVGGITESDVNLAKAGGAIVIGFHVRPAGKAAPLAEQEGVDIKLYDIIYEAIDDVKKAMVGLLPAIRREKAMGKIEVRLVYNIPKLGTVAGCAVTDGKVTRQAQVRLVRDAVQLWSGKLASLKRFKDDVREVEKGYECGLTLEGFNDIKIGDTIEAFEIVEEAPTL